MVHNGIEYGMMAAYAEGLNILKNANAGKVQREADAETAPLEQPEYYQYDLDLPEVAEVWRRGSVIGSWLLDLTAASMQESPDLAEFAGRVSDSGEGRWTSIAAIDEGVPAPVLTTALYERFYSRGLDDFADKVLSAMRKQFGGHDEKPSLRRRQMAIELEVCADEKAAARRAAELIAGDGAAAAAERGAFSLRDERRPHALGDAGDPRRTGGDALGRRPSSSRSTSGSPRRAARTATSPTWCSASRWTTRRRCGRCRSPSATSTAPPASTKARCPSRSTCVHLGLGPDGHTASLVPGDPVLEVSDRRVALTETAYQGHRRMTLTYPALDAARQIVWLVTGPEKREPLAKLLAGDTSIPAGRVENERDDRDRRRGRLAELARVVPVLAIGLRSSQGVENSTAFSVSFEMEMHR